LGTVQTSAMMTMIEGGRQSMENHLVDMILSGGSLPHEIQE